MSAERSFNGSSSGAGVRSQSRQSRSPELTTTKLGRNTSRCLCARESGTVGGEVGWLRAAVLGANDGLLSTASLVLGVAAAHEPPGGVLIAGIAGLVAGAMSMAAGEYVSVHSQADTEQADLVLERAELRADDKGEHQELAAIYVERGLDASLARQVADQLMAHDAIGAHARAMNSACRRRSAPGRFRLRLRRPAASP